MKDDDKLFYLIALMQDMRNDWSKNNEDRARIILFIAGGYNNAPIPILTCASARLLVNLLETLNYPVYAFKLLADTMLPEEGKNGK